MSRTAYDSATPSAVPDTAKVVLYYLDGYKWTAADLARFPGAVKVSITVEGHPAGDIADSEAGAMTPEQVAAWIRSRAGHKSTVYCSKDNWAAVRAACKGLSADWLIADWTGEPHGLPGAVGVQYAAPQHGSPGDYDLSFITDDGWYPSPQTDAERLARAAELAAELVAVTR